MGQQIRVLTDVLRSTPSTHVESFITGLEKTFNTFTLPIVYFKRQDKTRRTCTCVLAVCFSCRRRTFSREVCPLLSMFSGLSSRVFPTEILLAWLSLIQSSWLAYKAMGSIPRTLTKKIIVNNDALPCLKNAHNLNLEIF